MEQLGAQPPAAIDQWVDEAPAGDTFVYAVVSEDGRPPSSVLQHARKAYEAGYVTLTRRKSPGRIAYVMYRLAKREKAKVHAAQSPGSPELRVLAELRRAARTGAPCPSNDQLARAAELPDSYAASYVVRKLRDAGKIGVEMVGPRQRRQVTIRRTGKKTGIALA